MALADDLIRIASQTVTDQKLYPGGNPSFPSRERIYPTSPSTPTGVPPTGTDRVTYKSPQPNFTAPDNADAYTKYLYSWMQPMTDWWNQFAKSNGRNPSQDEWTTQFQNVLNDNGIAQVNPQVANDMWNYIYGQFKGTPLNQWGSNLSNEFNTLLTNENSQIPFAYKTASALPYQINPSVWDSLGTIGQNLTLSAVKASGQDPTEWLRQLNAARPVGAAPKNVMTQYAAGNQGVY